MSDHTNALPPDITGLETVTVLGLGLIPLIFIGLFATYLARKKGYSGLILVWAWVPVLNIYGLLLFVGLPDLFMRAKVDALAVRLLPPNRKTPDSVIDR